MKITEKNIDITKERLKKFFGKNKSFYEWYISSSKKNIPKKKVSIKEEDFFNLKKGFINLVLGRLSV